MTSKLKLSNLLKVGIFHKYLFEKFVFNIHFICLQNYDVGFRCDRSFDKIAFLETCPKKTLYNYTHVAVDGALHIRLGHPNEGD